MTRRCRACACRRCSPPRTEPTLPPATHDLDEAERSVVVLLADDNMAVDEDVPAGRQNWSAFVGDLWEKCQRSSHRFLPFQCSEHAWPLDPRLSETRFYRAWAQPGAAPEQTARTVVVDLCRYLEGEQRGEQLPMRLFLSHAKADVDTAPQVFNAIAAHLTATQPVKAWIDSADIDGGSKFTEAIEQGVRDLRAAGAGDAELRQSSLVPQGDPSREAPSAAHLSSSRRSRAWIPRSFPYGGNAPRLRWADDCAARAVDLVLKETLRHLHMRLVLRSHQRPDDMVLHSAARTGDARPNPTRDALSSIRIRLSATRNYKSSRRSAIVSRHRCNARPPAGRLEGMAVVLSISESGDAERHGVTADHLNAALHEVSRQLLVRGVRLEYGGHLGPEGYTTALFDMAAAHNRR